MTSVDGNPMDVLPRARRPLAMRLAKRIKLLSEHDPRRITLEHALLNIIYLGKFKWMGKTCRRYFRPAGPASANVEMVLQEWVFAAEFQPQEDMFEQGVHI